MNRCQNPIAFRYNQSDASGRKISSSRVVIPKNKDTKVGSNRPHVVECKENVVELRKLVQKWAELDNEKRKTICRLDSERHALKVKYRQILSGSMDNSSVEDTFVFEPGFRYKANGEQRKLDARSILSQLDKDADLLDVSQTESLQCNSRKHKSKTKVFGGRGDSQKDAIFSKDVLETEKALDEIRNSSELKEIHKKVTGVKSSLTFLRAHSNDLAANRRLFGMYGTPTQTTRSNERHNTSNSTGQLNWPQHSHRIKSNCVACGHRFLQKTSNDLQNQKSCMRELSSAVRWKYAPRGEYVKSACSLVPSKETSINSSTRIVTSKNGKIQKSISEKGPKIGHTQSLLHPHNKNLSIDLQPSSGGSAPNIKKLSEASPAVDKSVSVRWKPTKSVTTEDNYRLVMGRATMSSKQSLAILEEMCKSGDILNTKKVTSANLKDSQHHLGHHSVLSAKNRIKAEESRKDKSVSRHRPVS